MQYVVASALDGLPGRTQSDEIGLCVSASGLVLPCGATTLFTGADAQL